MATIIKGAEPFDKLRKEMKKSNGVRVDIGIHDDAGEYKDGENVAQVGYWNEFGTETIPERSWMRSTIDDNMSYLQNLQSDLADKIHSGETSMHKALSVIGFRIQALLQNKIQSNIAPVNAESTLKQKEKEGTGSETLQNTRLLLRSIAFKVFDK